MRYGVIGAGRVFEQYHRPVLEADDRVEIVTICDPDPEAVAESATTAHRCSTLDEFYATDVDAVSVCTPNDLHHDAVLGALDRGLPVLCEKPLAGAISEARSMVARAGDTLFAVNLPYRHHPLVGEFAAALSGVTSMYVQFTTPGLRFWRPRGTWYSSPQRAGGGALLDLGLHALDLVDRVLGPPEVDACAVDDQALEEKVELSLHAADTEVRVGIDRRSRRPRMTITGRTPDGEVVLDLARGTLTRADDVVHATNGAATLAVSGFLDAVVADDTSHVVHATDALRLQEVIHQAYERRVLFPDP